MLKKIPFTANSLHLNLPEVNNFRSLEICNKLYGQYRNDKKKLTPKVNVLSCLARKLNYSTPIPTQTEVHLLSFPCLTLSLATMLPSTVK